jgi:HNH endonuclease
LIAEARRKPKHCLYCSKPPITEEHIVPEAVGGRLWAHILCRVHNGLINTAADEPLSRNFAPFVNMLQVQRQRGVRGATFTATNDKNDPILILAEGFAKEKPLKVTRRDDQGRILNVEGDLTALDHLPKEAFADNKSSEVIALISNPEANFSVVSDDSLRAGLLKIALHFYAGFILDVALDESNELLPCILGSKIVGSDILRTPFLDDDVFADRWPARHEVTCYGDEGWALVTILLFGAYAYLCRLPLPFVAVYGVRYRQMLDEKFPRFVDDIPRPKSLSWDRRPCPEDRAAWLTPMQTRIRRIYARGVEQSIQARCRRAFERAVTESANFGSLWDRYRAALHLEVFSALEVETLVTIGKGLHRSGKNAWEVPVSLSEETASG